LPTIEDLEDDLGIVVVFEVDDDQAGLPWCDVWSRRTRHTVLLRGEVFA
jgi:hypothetical protein